MKREDYNGKTINVCAMPTTIMCGFSPVNGTMFYVANENNEYSIGNDGIWVQDLGAIQNHEVFLQGIKYVDQYASPKNQNICWEILKKMQAEKNKSSDWYCHMIAFFCDLGLWKNKKLCQSNVWHKDFPKYLSNNMWNYYITD